MILSLIVWWFPMLYPRFCSTYISSMFNIRLYDRPPFSDTFRGVTVSPHVFVTLCFANCAFANTCQQHRSPSLRFHLHIFVPHQKKHHHTKTSKWIYAEYRLFFPNIFFGTWLINNFLLEISLDEKIIYSPDFGSCRFICHIFSCFLRRVSLSLPCGITLKNVHQILQQQTNVHQILQHQTMM